ncbi:MAG: TIGR04222 domain-containing membrane protein, partial [Blastococcus sp.]|nr:TIGR04222 domain-containing membrane protein [Blastococcus sp.]
MTTPATTNRLDVYDMAVLAGGLPRLVDTVLVAMVESGRVRVGPSGEFRAEPTASSPHPVEAALLDAVGSRGHRTVETIHWQLLHDRRLDSEFRHLTSDGLVRRAYPAALLGKTHAHTTAAGRRALQQFAERPPADGGSAVQVALHGRDAMPDRRLHDA